MKSKESEHRLIIGLGSPMRGDDAFGLDVLAMLQKRSPKMAAYYRESGDLTRIIDQWENRQVVIVDAFDAGPSNLGRVFEASAIDKLSEVYSSKYSSHSVSLHQIFNLGAYISCLPRTYYIIGVGGVQWSIGDSMSPEVQEQIPNVADRIAKYFAEE